MNINLGKNVIVSTFTRPIKVVYIVPCEESKENQWLIDAIFYESYTRWAGTKTLIIPSDKDKFLYQEHEEWLRFYDADFVYSYIDLDTDLIEKINRLCCPISFIRHDCFSDDWRGYIPDWSRHNITFVSSISTICSPVCSRISHFENDPSIPIVITQSEIKKEDRFVSDNFGTSWGQPYINFQNNLFETLCLVPEKSNHLKKAYPTFSNPSSRGSANLIIGAKCGTHHASSKLEIFSKIAEKTAITVAKLAKIHSNNIPKIESYQFSRSFNIIVGDTYIDRINFWNFRNLTSDANSTEESSVLLIKTSLFNESEFVEILGKHLNNNNYTDRGTGGREVTLRSLSVERQELEDIKNILQRHTYNQVFLPENYNSPAIPSQEDLRDNNYLPRKNEHTFKINDRINSLEAKEPEHFIYTPANYLYLNAGRWAIDLKIERHNSFSRVVNLIDTWMLPRRRNITQCFTGNLSKVSKNNLLTIIPYDSSNFLSTDIYKKLEYELTLPEDTFFFQHLLQGEFRRVLGEKDMRLITTNQTPYKWHEVKLSDKGQNLRGVISMFDNISDAYECLTNKFWREVLGKYDKKHTLTYNVLFETLPRKDKDYKNQVKKTLKLNNKSINKYLHANFKDGLEYLIEKNIFYQVHLWRCDYCGHKNTKTIDEIKRENKCEICKTLYYVPIDLEWEYKLNRFVFNALFERNGLTVLWALGYLYNRSMENKLYFLPEVDFFYNENQKEEIDVLCVLDGKFIVGEVKKSVLGFTEDENEIQKFIKKINHLKPDTALLVFEQYSKESKDHKLAKQRLKDALNKIENSIPEYIKVAVIFATMDYKFTKYPIEIPPGYGPRTNKIFDSR